MNPQTDPKENKLPIFPRMFFGALLVGISAFIAPLVYAIVLRIVTGEQLGWGGIAIAALMIYVPPYAFAVALPAFYFAKTRRLFTRIYLAFVILFGLIIVAALISAPFAEKARQARTDRENGITSAEIQAAGNATSLNDCKALSMTPRAWSMCIGKSTDTYEEVADCVSYVTSQPTRWVKEKDYYNYYLAACLIQGGLWDTGSVGFPGEKENPLDWCNDLDTTHIDFDTYKQECVRSIQTDRNAAGLSF